MNTALLLIAHGSRNPQANADLHHLAEMLRTRGHLLVVPSFLELAEPSIEQGGRACVAAGAECILLVPYFLSAGVHVQRDLVRARDTLNQEFPHLKFVLAEPLGRHPLLVEIVSQRVQEALFGVSKFPHEESAARMHDVVQNSPTGSSQPKSLNQSVIPS